MVRKSGFNIVSKSNHFSDFDLVSSSENYLLLSEY